VEFCLFVMGIICAGVISLDTVDKQNVTMDVMPLIGGFLPLPLVRLSKYIPADQKTQSRGMYELIVHCSFISLKYC
jgi:hypothetical protein